MSNKIEEFLFTKQLRDEFNNTKELSEKEIKDKIIKEIDNNSTLKKLSEGLYPKQINVWGIIVAYKLCQAKLKYTQLRRFVDAIKDINNLSEWNEKKRKIDIFPVYLINGYARQQSLKLFSFLFSEIIESDFIKDSDDLTTLLNFLDSILAYFKALNEEEDNND